jgi:hypothetical protein
MMPTSRRRFLRTAAGTASLGLADVTSLGALRTFAGEEGTAGCRGFISCGRGGP